MSSYTQPSPTVGIDDISTYIPKLMLPIETLAEARNLEYAKLNKGLGLEVMSVPDAHEDVATMAANAVLDLILKNGLTPQSIGRIYVGTESAVDGSKPTASYVLDMLSQYFSEEYGEDCLLNCDVVDMTFACIGAVDALQNTLDWVRAGDGRIGIVVGSDVAKYELNSGGEYTQGAGAVAVLVRQQPQLMVIPDVWGVAARSVHDFFKPLRTVSKTELIEEVLQLLQQPGLTAQDVLSKLNGNINQEGVLDSQDAFITLHRETPVFDGPFSNLCYRNRIWEALQHFAQQNGNDPDAPITDDWYRLVFHLPYAFQARRMFSEVFMIEARRRGDWDALQAELNMEKPKIEDFVEGPDYEKAYNKFLRAITKTDRYRHFVKEKIAKGETASSLVGNLYTSSILLSLVGTLEAALEEERDLTDTTFGFFAYGSGSKSKVFTGVLQPQWREITSRFGLFDKLNQRTTINYEQYERLHRKQQKESVLKPAGTFYLEAVCQEKSVNEGARTYSWAVNSKQLTVNS
jgi:hydroxymethylglutaryl-CoA synthase